MTEQELTQKILRDANKQAKTMITAAKQHAEKQLFVAKEQAAARKAEALEQGQANLAYRQSQQQLAHEVSKIKAQINAEQGLIDQAFATAREKLLHATDKEIKELVDTYTKKYAKTGDKVLIAKNWAHACPKLPTTAAIQSGIIIENPTYRIELDIDSILNELREPLAAPVAKILGVL